ncbi:carboxypeptidase-like regulatory domain-containing protein [Lysobacter yananisis]|uniref:Carboxypeptidase-like regulatory domain-containing protein n=1 Tax=Lysobacter yananisis TaxID=1003114 RepID=A0ABY9PCX7_9GAMM|nr:carboxypeptidase-like regulatory domain-containing protein [Lysobacter yananisis]WMT04620.1 carboxypeptidase-like regulatory domain-containing protein [Lysobacter yananisis]
MTARARPPRPRRLAVALALALCACAAPAAAQDGAAAAEYRDRIIAPQALAPLPPDPEDALDDSGLPRSLRLSLDYARNERGGEAYDERGLSLGGYWETADWGAFSLDAAALRSDRDGGRDWGGAATLWQRGVYLDGGWRGDNGLGVIATPAPELQRNQYRFFLPTVAMAGASSQWTRADDGRSVYAAFGRAGVFAGTRTVGFELADGDVAALGAQWQPAPGWTASAALLGSDGRIAPDARGDAAYLAGATRAGHWAARWSSGADSVQFNLLNSHGRDGNASGGWIDASARRGRFRHDAGVFSLDPGLAWGALPINQDVRGGYYRLGYQYGRWLWNASLDEIRSIRGDGFDGRYATAFARYQASTRLGYGASTSLRQAERGGDAYSLQAFADWRSDWGQTRLQLDRADAGGGERSWQASLDQALPLPEGQHLSLSLAYAELGQRARQATRSASLSLYGGLRLGQRWNLDGNARWTDGDGPSALRGGDVNLSLTGQLARGWSLSAALFQSRGSQRSPFLLDPLALDSPFQRLPRERSALLTLRYDWQAGRPLPVLGAAPDAASGDIAGVVYLDDNGDGVRAASERPAANVTVLLDGRWAARTDSSGAFAFARVSVGEHRIQVLADNLPLPWTLDEAPTAVRVSVRDAARVDIGATRPR